MSSPRTAAPWSNVYGVARTLLAIGTLITLALNSADQLFMPLGKSLHPIMGRVFPAKYSLFLLFDPPYLEVARWIAIAILVVVAIGWRPRITALLHWWVSASFTAAGIVLDGGDQVTAVLTLLLLPIALTDGRRWHWSRAQATEPTTHWGVAAVLIATSTLLILRVQMAAIYFNAGVAKMFVPEWANGTAMYYWVTSPLFGSGDWLQHLLSPVVRHGVAVTLFTWSVMMFEVLLATALVMSRRWWQPLLVAGLLFHAGIALIHGLVSFMFAMDAGLILYLRPWDRPFDLAPLRAVLARVPRLSRVPAPTPPALPAD